MWGQSSPCVPAMGTWREWELGAELGALCCCPQGQGAAPCCSAMHCPAASGGVPLCPPVTLCPPCPPGQPLCPCGTAGPGRHIPAPHGPDVPLSPRVCLWCCQVKHVKSQSPPQGGTAASQGRVCSVFPKQTGTGAGAALLCPCFSGQHAGNSRSQFWKQGVRKVSHSLLEFLPRIRFEFFFKSPDYLRSKLN